MQQNQETFPRWDLTTLYASPEDPDLWEDVNTIKELSSRFQSNYKLRVNALSGDELFTAFQQEGQIHKMVAKISLYAHLSFAADTRNNSVKKMLSRWEEAQSEISQTLLFFNLELASANGEKWKSEAKLAPYQYHIEDLQKHAPHQLSEEMEAYSVEKDLTGRNALTSLFDEYFGEFTVQVSLKDGEKVFTEEEALSTLHSPDREYRTTVYGSFLREVGKGRVVLENIYNNIMLDHRLDLQRRKFSGLMEERHLSNQISGSSVNTMLETVEKGYQIAQRYFSFKARLLGIPDFTNADIYAPLSTVQELISFESAKDLVISSFSDFHAGAGRLVEQFFQDRRVDAATLPGKRSGAFCYGADPGLDAYVHLNYTGDIRSVETLAHELGHGLHHQLACKERNHTNFDTPLVTAETASVFGEMLLSERLIATRPGGERELAIRAARMEGIIATVFRQTVLTRFEQRAHEARRNGRVDSDTLCAIWWEENEKLYGDSLNMVEDYRWGWAYIPHFIHTPFYCYAYSFGQLLVLSLYSEYRQKGDSFRDGFLGLLAAGGSNTPARLIQEYTGLDIESEQFWSLSLQQMEGEMAAIEALAV